MFDKNKINQISNLLLDSKKIVLISHKNPDGDTLGASLAMYHYLKGKGHQVESIVPNHYPAFYAWMPGIEDMHVFEGHAAAVRQLIQDADLVFCLDFNSMSRAGNLAADLLKTKAVKIMIDHHLAPSDEFDFVFSEINTSSTGELVYEFIHELGEIDRLGINEALALYVCIMTDTGSFSFSCNRPRTYEIIADLVRRGVDAAKVHKLVYDTFSENRLRLLGYALSSKMEVWQPLHAAAIHLNKKDLSRFDFQVGDTEGVVNYPLSMAKVNLSVLLTEKDDLIRLSFRSKGSFDVNQFARKHFNGGGHRNAAGGNSALTMSETLRKLKDLLQTYSESLSYTLSL
jgi:phosphoesterase RecJ-like protein